MSSQRLVLSLLLYFIIIGGARSYYFVNFGPAKVYLSLEQEDDKFGSLYQYAATVQDVHGGPKGLRFSIDEPRYLNDLAKPSLFVRVEGSDFSVAEGDCYSNGHYYTCEYFSLARRMHNQVDKIQKMALKCPHLNCSL